jgi:multiple sugar transport system substrate-binding protein
MQAQAHHRKMKIKNAVLLCAILLAGLFAGCGAPNAAPKETITLTMWHNMGGRVPDMIGILIDEFNAGVGKDNGVIVSVTSVTPTRDIDDNMEMIRHGDPGAPEMPDIVPLYPNVALGLMEEGLLAPLDDLFSQEELDAYQPQYLDVGRLTDGRLYVFPFAKSTEVLYLDQTLFERFAAETGAKNEDLLTAEGLADTAVRYYEWTDALTPDTENDGKAFFSADSWFNFYAVAMVQLGDRDFIGEKSLNVDSPAFRRIWDASVSPAVLGGYAITDSYSSTLAMTGDILSATGSTAGMQYYGNQNITYADNTTEAVEYSINPYPVMRGGTSAVLQRGSGMVISKSTPEREAAAALFLKWFTDPAQNVRYALPTGYLPVMKNALDSADISALPEGTDVQTLEKLLVTVRSMEQTYGFVTAPQNANLTAMSSDFESKLNQTMQEGRARVLAGEDPDAVCEALYRDFLK